MSPDSTTGIRLIYDGECPLCSAYVRRYRLERAVGDLQLLDARLHPEVVDELARAGQPLDEGFVLELHGQRYHGAEALHRLALMSTRSGAFNRLNAALFRSPKVSRWAYPVLRAGRNLLLRLLGRKPLLQDC